MSDNRKYPLDQDIRELTLEQQLERMTEQRNNLIDLLEFWAYRARGQQAEENLIRSPGDVLRQAVSALQKCLEEYEIAEPDEHFLSDDGVRQALHETVGNLYITEGGWPQSDGEIDQDPDWERHPPEKGPQ